MESVVATEVALQEFDRFIENMGLLVDTSSMDDEDKSSFDKHKARIVRAVEVGSLVFNDDGEAVYTPQHSRTKHKDPITFHERSGASLMATDGKKRGHEVAKTYAVMGDMCKLHPSVFANMVGVDVRVCESIYVLLMD